MVEKTLLLFEIYNRVFKSTDSWVWLKKPYSYLKSTTGSLKVWIAGYG
jgi:hypothetical protein